ncbi:MAG: hypothetical protein LC100_10365, partial [Chitinophagales bacterium]|nr:hypothetical protein [Chitinophagales bacterium]
VKHRMTEGIVMRFRIRRGMTTTKKAKSLGTPTRNLVYHPDEIPCQAQNDRGYSDEVPHQARNDNHPKKAKSLRAPTRNLVYHPNIPFPA